MYVCSWDLKSRVNSKLPLLSHYIRYLPILPASSFMPLHSKIKRLHEVLSVHGRRLLARFVTMGLLRHQGGGAVWFKIRQATTKCSIVLRITRDPGFNHPWGRPKNPMDHLKPLTVPKDFFTPKGWLSKNPKQSCKRSFFGRSRSKI